MQPVRNSHIIRHTLRNYLAAAIFAGIIIQLNSTIDSMVAGQFIGADAVSVIILALPLVNILMLPGTILLMGATLLIAPAFGNQDYSRVNKMLTVGLASALAISAVFTALLAIFAGPVSLFITQDARLQPMLQEYFPFAFAGSFFGLFACAGSQFVQISGRPRLVAWFVGIFGVLNLALDILFVRVLDMGIRGAAAGTSAAAVLGFLVMVPYLLREPRPYRLCWPGWACFRSYFREILRRGTAAAMTGVSMIILNLGLNTLVLSKLGADGMFTLSICMQLLMICMLVLTATGGTITGLGGLRGYYPPSGFPRQSGFALRGRYSPGTAVGRAAPHLQRDFPSGNAPDDAGQCLSAGETRADGGFSAGRDRCLHPAPGAGLFRLEPVGSPAAGDAASYAGWAGGIGPSLPDGRKPASGLAHAYRRGAAFFHRERGVFPGKRFPEIPPPLQKD